MRSVALLLIALIAVGCKDSKPQQSGAKTGSGARRAPAVPSLDRPLATAPSLVKVTKLSATVFYSLTDLQFGGSSLGRLRDGVIDHERVDHLLRLLEVPGASGDPIGVSLDPTLPYLRVSELLFNLKTAGYRNVALLTPGSMPIPLEMIDSDQVSADGLRPVITLSGGRLMLWSASGEEGTQSAPKLSIPSAGSYDALTKALSEIVQRRWPDGMRPPVDRTIVVQVGSRETALTLMHLLATVRSDGNLELFPTIFLAGGV